MTNPTSGNLSLWDGRAISGVVQVLNLDCGKDGTMINGYEWVDKGEDCQRDFGPKDFALGWIIYSMAVICLIV